MVQKVKSTEDQVLTVNALSHEGRGLATLNNRTIFIDNALPEEVVRISYVKKSRRYDEAKADEIIKASPQRVEPHCAHFTICGGCSLQHMKSDAQISHKEKVLLEHLAHFGKITAEKVLPPIRGSIFGYRRKARLGVRFVAKKAKFLVGFREKYSNKLAEIAQCEVLHPSVGKRLTELQMLIHGLEGMQSIPQIEVAVGDGETALVFRHLAQLSSHDQQSLIEFSNKTDILIYLQPKGPESIHLLHPERATEYLDYAFPAYGIRFFFKPQDFTQINSEINQQMVKQAIDLLEPKSNDCILDLFCGLGNFSLPLARFAKRVIGIEGNDQMTLRAAYNAEQNGISNAMFIAMNLEEITSEAWSKTRLTAVTAGINPQIECINKVLLDPPRTGAYPLVSFLAKEKTIEKIVYVSCNPATLARDLGVLVHEGKFHLKSVQVLDMFPHTAHVESMALLVRQKKW